MDLEQLLKKNRPNLSENSIKTYKSILNTLSKKLDLNDIEDFESKQNEIIEHFKEIPANKRKTTLSALVVLCESNKKICDKYRELMILDAKKVNEEEETNEMTDKQAENWLEFSEIEKVFSELEKKVKSKWSKEKLTMKDLQELQDVVILSLYVLIPPRRLLDYTEFKIFKNSNIDKEKDNYMEKNNFIFNTYKTTKYYGEQSVEIPKKLKNILNKWIKINPTEYLLFDTNKNKLTVSQLNQRLNKIFDGKKISVNILRHSYITDKVLPKEMKAIDELKEIANDMGHNISQQAIYRKIIRKNDKK